MKQILIAGGAGFLGSHLVDRILKKEPESHIIIADNFFTGDHRNLHHVIDNKRIELIRHDVTTSLYIEVDEIYNLACPASPIFYQKNPVQTLKTNVHGTINLLGLAKRVGAKILQASTSEVYGNPTVHPQTEEYWGRANPIGIRACYDEGKRCAEALMFDYQRQYGVDIRVVRIFNTYGPRMRPDDGRVVSNFIVSALRNEEITIYGDGSQTRSFCYVDDLIDGMYTMMQSDTTGPINLGNCDEITVATLAELIVKLTNSKSKLSYHQLPEDDPVRRQPDTSKAKKHLSWEATTALELGISKTIDYFTNYL